MISVSDVSKVYNTAEQTIFALNHVSLHIRQGELVAIVGESGSGKSTLMNILGCLDIPTSGTYRLLDRETQLLSKRELSAIRRQEIGFVFQRFHLLNSLSALENVELPMIYSRIPPHERYKRAKSALSQVGLDSRLSHRPSEMSGGQQQRVAIARALVTNPHLILADEPTGNLDSKSGLDILNLLCELHRAGRTVVLITHDEKIAARAERTIRISDGCICS